MGVLAIIGGTALPSITGWNETDRQTITTPYGDPSAPILKGEVNKQPLVFLPRHGENHTIPPHSINYRANLWALREVGVSEIVAITAVGGIDSKAAPAMIVFPNQIVDYTWGRAHTFFDGPDVQHVDFTYPYSEDLRGRLVDSAQRANIAFVDGGVYGATQGPRLESAAEIDRMERDGCTLVGMTGMPEATLARELDLRYACCALVVNWAAGRSDKIIDMDTIAQNVAAGQKSIVATINRLLSP